MPWQLHLIVQIVLTAIQCLVPAFFPLNPKQDEAIHTFVSAVQGILVMYAHFQDPNTNSVPSPDSPVKPVAKSSIQGLNWVPINRYFKGHGDEVMSNMTKEYGAKKGKSVFYALANKKGLKPGSAANSKPVMSRKKGS